MGRSRRWMAALLGLSTFAVVTGQLRTTRTAQVAARPPSPAVTNVAAGPVPAVTLTWYPGTGGTCRWTSPLGTADGHQDRPPHLATDPDQARLSWLPGLNATRTECTVHVTTTGAAVARRLAGQVNASTPFPDGPVNCPADLTLAAPVSVRSAIGWQTVQIETTGCPDIRAAGFALRWAPDDVLADLVELAPADWGGVLH